MTVVRNQVSDPSQFFVSYGDDAVGLTQWDTEFDNFFWYSAVKLNSSWVETAEVKQRNWVLDITQLGTLTSGDNVMIKFPVRWIKMSRSWTQVTLSITKELGKSWYRYYPFQKTWDISTNTENTPTYPVYLWAYVWYNDSGTLKSLSWQTPASSQTMSTVLTRAAANGTWWTIMWWYQRCLIVAYYMMKYCNPNSANVIWKWYVAQINWSYVRTTTWWTNNIQNATYWTSSDQQQMKLFWLEDFYWNSNCWLWWIFLKNTSWYPDVYTALHDFTWDWQPGASYKSIGTLAKDTANKCLSSIYAGNKRDFLRAGVVSNTSYNTYYCAYVDHYVSSYLCNARDDQSSISSKIFSHRTYSSTSANPSHNARIMYM